MNDAPMSARSEPFRVLIIAEAANPEWVSVPLVGYSHARALMRITDAHLVTQIRNAEALRRAGLADTEFTAIDSEKAARVAFKLGEALRGGAGKGWTTAQAFATLAYPYFEYLAWQRFGNDIGKGRYDIVHRLTPLTPTAPSLLARRCARAGVPFVLGPLNGGAPWPSGFDAERRREAEWLSYVRDAYRLLPGYRATRRYSAAILVGSRDTLAQIPKKYRPKCVYLPENAVDPERFGAEVERPPAPPLRIAFLGRLVPYKGVDMLIRAAAPLLREGRAELDIIGDGPERAALEALAAREKVGDRVTFAGHVEHQLVAARLGAAHVLGFPSVREFGGGVVLEAMALGVVPLVVDYAGPAELVTPVTGVAIPVGSREAIVERLRRELEALAADPARLRPLSRAARARALGNFTWDAKARQVLEVYRWVLGRRSDKPDFGMPMRDGPVSHAPPALTREGTLP